MDAKDFSIGRVPILPAVILLGGLALAGCARSRAVAPPPGSGAGAAPTRAVGTNQTFIVTPETVLVAKVAHVNPDGRFVVLTFPLGKMAAIEQRFSLYRRGLKVGEVKVCGPQREDNIVADLVAGAAQVGDEARSE